MLTAKLLSYASRRTLSMKWIGTREELNLPAPDKRSVHGADWNHTLVRHPEVIR